uniref:Cystatin domain-containing protein n=1 Tax=Panagrolaimus sp. ES5 TaxID=591445 RepID=A0AC34F6E0_9BILA
MFFRVFLFTSIMLLLTDAQKITTLGPAPGAPGNMDTKSLKVQELANKIMTKYNTVSNDPYYYTYVEVISATEQVVAGLLYRIKLSIGKTDCLKNQVSAAANLCNVDKNSIKEINARIVDQPWLNIFEITFE